MKLGSEFLSLSDFFWQKTNNDGCLVCPWHKTEHTGKNIYAAAVDGFLYKESMNDLYFQRAKKRIFYTLSKLDYDSKSGAWIFYPGRFGKYNLSNNVIDCGACIDVLSNFYNDYQNRLTAIEKEQIKGTIEKVANTYLVNAVVTKEVSNQRLWGATGLSAAYKVFKEEKWKQACIKSIEKSLIEQNEDGSFPYHYNWKDFCINEGISDFSPYYQSRHTAFIIYIVNNIDPRIINNYMTSLLKSCDFLVGITHPNGVKEMGLESKRYYWNNFYEVGSNSFDVYALAKIYKITMQDLYGYYANESFKRLIEHKSKDGGLIGSFLDSRDFKCRIFINAHSIWAIRAMEDLPSAKIRLVNEEFNFKNAGVYKYRNKNYCVIIRYKKKPIDITRGSLAGGGSIIYFSGSDWKNKLAPQGFFGFSNCNFTLIPFKQNFLKNLKEFFKYNKPKDFKFRLWTITAQFLSGKYTKGLSDIALKIIFPILASPIAFYTSQWPLDSTLKEKKNNRIIIFSNLSDRQGIFYAAGLHREYLIVDKKIKVKEILLLHNNGAFCFYSLPKKFCNFCCNNSYLFLGRSIFIFSRRKRIELSYVLK